MEEINKILFQIKIATAIKDISFLLMIGSLVAIMVSLIKNRKEIRKPGLFDYYFEYYDENGKLVKKEKITKEQYKNSPKKTWIEN